MEMLLRTVKLPTLCVSLLPIPMLVWIQLCFLFFTLDLELFACVVAIQMPARCAELRCRLEQCLQTHGGKPPLLRVITAMSSGSVNINNTDDSMSNLCLLVDSSGS
ncbi:unnamed protein product [Ostreobium quekettii]|uniref:Uncharacterized protein n=1 Tax=Ostreobium quekettii TaxID=121088 RepID=A0A8S1J825_9CHLO|nr:unnamed protein product [Ostreobium quekettii]